MYSIALKYDTSVNAIINRNNLTDTTLSVGDILIIPGDVESTGEDEDVTSTNTYVVQKGDSLYSIAKRFNVGLSELKEINNLSERIE